MAACAEDTLKAAPFPTAAGVLAEMQGRPGREVWAWLARPVGPASTPAGLAILVAAGQSAHLRWSIGLLVVDPACRRRGVGMSLVATAVHFAEVRGASVVHAETLDRWPAAAAFWRAARLAAERHLTRLPVSGESRKTAEG